MAETIKGINVVIGADTTGLSKALSDVNKKSRDIQSELKQVERLLKFDPSNTEILAQKHKLLADAIQNTQEKLNRLRTVQEQVNEQFARGEISEGQYRAFQREVAKTEQELAKLEKQLKDMQPAVETLGEKLEKAGEKIKSAGEKITDVGKKLSVGVTAPITAIGTAATKMAVDFESAFAGVRKTVDATEEEFAQLEQGIRDMSKQMPASATDIAAVAEAAGQLGIETGNILKFTEVMIGLGEATNLTAEEGATQFARFANIVGMSQNDFDRLGSSVVALGNSFATTEAEIVAMGMRLAGQGAQIGMTEAQIMALAAAMSSVGIEAEAGGTAMSTTLKKMQTAVSLAGEDLDKFAAVARMSAKDFATAFNTDPAKALQAFIDGLAESSAAGENLTLILNDLGISGIRESDTLLRLAGASDVLRGAVATATQAWEENSALQNEVAQRYATTESQLAMFKNSLMDLGMQIGEIIVPALISLVAAVQPVIDWFANLDQGTQQLIVTIAGLAAALGPLLIIIGQVAQGIGALMPILAGLTSPIGLVVTVIAGLVAGLTYLYTTNETVRDALNTAWEFIKNAAETIFSAIKNFWETWGKDIFEFFKRTFEQVKEVLKAAFELIFEIAKKVFEQLKKFWDTWGETITIAFKTVWNTIKSVVEGVWNSIKIVVETALNAIKGIINTITSIIKGDWQGAWNGIKDVVVSIWNGITGFFSNAIGTMTEIGKNIIQGLINGIGSMANAVWEKAKSIASGIWDSITGFFGINSPSRLMMEAGNYIGQGLAIGLEDTTKKAVEAAKHVSSAVEDALKVNPASVSVAVNETLGATSSQGQMIINMDGLLRGANLYIRNDNDIKLLAQELWNMGQQAQRGLGGARV